MLSSLSPPHWANSLPPKTGKGGDKWDSGYEKTAFFLQWIDKRYGDGTVRELNEKLNDKEYDKAMWKQVTGRRVNKLWLIYCKAMGTVETEGGASDDGEDGEDMKETVKEVKEPVQGKEPDAHSLRSEGSDFDDLVLIDKEEVPASN